MSIFLRLSLLHDEYAVCQLPPVAEFPAWARGEFVSLTRTDDEFSVVCPASQVPAETKAERGWRALKVLGPLDFSLVGILASLTGVLSDAGVSIFAISTYDTDYILLKAQALERGLSALREVGYQLQE